MQIRANRQAKQGQSHKFRINITVAQPDMIRSYLLTTAEPPVSGHQHQHRQQCSLPFSSLGTGTNKRQGFQIAKCVCVQCINFKQTGCLAKTAPLLETLANYETNRLINPMAFYQTHIFSSYFTSIYQVL